MSITNTPSLADMAAGLAVAASTVGPVQNVMQTIDKGAEVFLQHNAALAPVVSGAEAALSEAASEHGLGTVWSMLQYLLPFLSQTPAAPVHAAPAATPAA